MRTRVCRSAAVLGAAAVVIGLASTTGFAAADKDVNVINTAAHPVPTVIQGPVIFQDADQPARHPFADVKDLSLDEGQSQGYIDFDPIPEGRRLVVETVTARSLAAAGQTWDVSLFVTTNGVPVAHTLALSTFQTLGYIDIRTATLPVRLYADPGTTMKVFGHRQGGNVGSAGVFVTISGYFVDVP